jgi:Family of unknown function (DUF5908)
MPVEVRQLIIKATVSAEGSSGEKAGGNDPAQASQEIIRACIEKVMELIKEKNGR